MRLFRPGFFAYWLYPEAIFRIKTSEKLLCLTFDDGPHPDSTPELLVLLDRYNVRALFFCDGRAAEKYPELVELIILKGHIIGNHGFSHLNGWSTSTDAYMEDIKRAADLIDSGLFRPPFGRIKRGQYRILKENFKIVFWDVIPYDFDKSFGSVKSLGILKRKIRPGSIIVLHDTPFSSANKIVGDFIVYAVSSGYTFCSRIN
jgi:peptidoglycan-N-acetylglucosamine deacetylase